jgi:hypothetical protein
MIACQRPPKLQVGEEPSPASGRAAAAVPTSSPRLAAAAAAASPLPFLKDVKALIAWKESTETMRENYLPFW